MKVLANERVISFLKHLACLPAAWVIAQYGDHWVAYIEGGTAILFVVYVVALLLVMFGLLAPVMLFPKRWQLFVAIPVGIAILTLTMPYINDLKERADKNPVVHKKSAPDSGLIAI
jgi:low affinity Fe/Cu permease